MSFELGIGHCLSISERIGDCEPDICQFSADRRQPTATTGRIHAGAGHERVPAETTARCGANA